MSKAAFAMYIMVVVPIIAAMNYGFALLGEPRAVWLMTILGLM